MSSLRIALFRDFVEEQWPSMDHFATLLSQELQRLPGLAVSELCPPYRHLPATTSGSPLRKLERFGNRYALYPPYVFQTRRQFDIFHILDHSYAHLAHLTPSARTIVHCHDIDLFRCLLDPSAELRPWWFQRLASHVLAGLRRAAQVVCISEHTRRELVDSRFFPAARTSVIRPGIDDLFFERSSPEAEAAVADFLGPQNLRPYLLHVGSTIPRKRVELVIEIFSRLRAEWPALRLVRVGAPLTGAQQALADRLGVLPHITFLNGIPTAFLAALYRGAFATLQPSAAEGFGLPIAEAMACGCPVVMSDLPVFREVAGATALYVSSSDAEAWATRVLSTATPAFRQALRTAGMARARRYKWSAAAALVREVYDSLPPRNPI